MTQRRWKYTRRRRRWARLSPATLAVLTVPCVAAVALFLWREVGQPGAPGAVGMPQRVGDEIAGRASVIDGDTVEIRGQRIRLFAMDAPESGQTCERDGETYRCGQVAANTLDAFLVNRTLRCDQLDYDSRCARGVSICWTGGIDVGEWMVEGGWAVAATKYSSRYVAAEERAKANKVGLWAGEFVSPEEWRRSH